MIKSINILQTIKASSFSTRVAADRNNHISFPSLQNLAKVIVTRKRDEQNKIQLLILYTFAKLIYICLILELKSRPKHVHLSMTNIVYCSLQSCRNSYLHSCTMWFRSCCSFSSAMIAICVGKSFAKIQHLPFLMWATRLLHDRFDLFRFIQTS